MSSEQPKLNNSEADNQTTSGNAEAQPQRTMMASQPAAATQPDPEDADDSRATGDVDYGQLLDQFEQAQATPEEREVVRGTGVGTRESG